jgi:hypothetical protein
MQFTLYTCRSLQKAWYTSLLIAPATIRNIVLHVTFKLSPEKEDAPREAASYDPVLHCISIGEVMHGEKECSI